MRHGVDQSHWLRVAGDALWGHERVRPWFRGWRRSHRGLPADPFCHGRRSRLTIERLVATGTARRLPSRLLHRRFGFQTVQVAEQGRHRQRVAAAPETDQAVLGHKVAFDGELVPAFGMADIIDGDVIVLTPEERNSCEFFAKPQHVARGRLPLPRGHNPMLHTDGCTAVPVGPARNVTGGIDVRRAGLEIIVHGDAPVEREAGGFCQLDARSYAYAQYGKIGF